MKPSCSSVSPLAAITLLLALSTPIHAFALSFPWSLNRYQHTSFTKRDGAPQAATSLAQTNEGYLWSNGATGLYSFDGQRFQHFSPRQGEKLLGNQVQHVFAPKTGGLWISYDVPGISFINHGHITNYETNAGWPGTSGQFLQDRQGNVMAFTGHGLMKLIDGAWKQVEAVPPSLDRAQVFQDTSFNIWAISPDGDVFVLREGEHRFTPLQPRIKGGFKLGVGGDRVVFIQTRDHEIRRFIDNDGHLSEVGVPIPLYGSRPIVDQRGNVWIGTANDGVHFLGPLSGLSVGDQPLPADEKLNHSGGLTGNYSSLFEDRAGDVWVVTEGGVDRFTPSAFSQLTFPTGMTMISIAPGKQGDVWIGSESLKVIHYDQETAIQTDVPWMAISTFSDPSDGAVFAATVDDLWQLAPGTPAKLADLPVHGGGVVSAITRDLTDTLWVSFRSGKVQLATFKEGIWEEPVDIGRPTSLATDSVGTVWAGFSKNRLVSIHKGEVKQYLEGDKLSIGVIKVIDTHGGRLWLGGDEGLQVFSAGSFRALHLMGNHALTNISGLLFDSDDNLWVHTVEGLFRIPNDAVRHALSDPGFAMPYRLFDSDDGVPGIPAQTYSLPTLRLGSDGRIWITGQTAAAWLDPHELPSEPRLAQPVIERISDRQHDYDLAGSELRLPKEARDLQIDYTTPELAFPSRVQFQYRLKGFDDRWQDAGSRRQAFYPHLPAGSFTFEVRSKIDGQAWVSTPTSISFSITPKYFETWWFRSVVVLFFLAALWALIRLQIRFATSRVQNHMRIRFDEREAVARDLHDTFLQSTQALVLQLGTLADIAADTELKKRIFVLAKMSSDALVEGRDKVGFLRSQHQTSGDEVAKLVRLGVGMSSQYNNTFSTKIYGSPRPLNQLANDELLPLVSELLINAFRHARATSITLSLSFGFWRCVVAVSDNGIGIDHAVVAKGRKEGHWGIKGVEERAARIGGSVRFHRLRTGGTKVVVITPARRIYSGKSKPSMDSEE